MYRSQSLGMMQVFALIVFVGVASLGVFVAANLSRGRNAPQGEVSLGRRLAFYDFANDANGWRAVDYGAAGAFRTEAGALLGSVQAQRGFLSTHTLRTFDNIAIDATLRQPAAPTPDLTTSAGVMCHADPDGNGYYFLIASSGRASIRAGLASHPDDLLPLVDWTPHPALRPLDEENRVRAYCADGYLALYVNEVFVMDVRDTRLQRGGVGLTLATAHADALTVSAQVLFDDVSIWEGLRVAGG